MTARSEPLGSSGPGVGWGWRVAAAIRRAYGVLDGSEPHPLHRSTIAGAVAVVTTAAATHSATAVGGVTAVAAAVAIAVDARGGRAALLVILLAVVGLWRSGDAAASLAPDRLGPHTGWVRLVDDPQPYPGSTRVIVEIDGERFESWARGRARRIRVDRWRGGEYVLVSGMRRALDAERADRVRWQHVVGEIEIDWASDVRAGSPIDRASNRVRETIERGAGALAADDGALFRGLVVGDDRDQPEEMIDRFRASGLSHLTAVSGQNVAFVLAVAGPVLRRLRPWWRWAATVAVIGWFVSLTRFEPSIVRAGAMAALSATAFVTGRERSPVRVLGVAVVGLLLVDPLLVWSVGFWLSVGATAGVSSVGPWLAGRLQVLGPLAVPVGVTLGAQVGVALPAWWVFGRLPLASLPANVLAVPVAGFVMLYGLPAGLLAGAVPQVAPVVMFPCRVGVRWVDTVAVLGERLEPSPGVAWLGWAVVAVAIGAIAAMNGIRHGRASADR